MKTKAEREAVRNRLLKQPFMGGAPAELQNALREALYALADKDAEIASLRQTIFDAQAELNALLGELAFVHRTDL